MRSDGVAVGTLGTKIDLQADASREYVAYVWKSTTGFDEWRNGADPKPPAQILICIQ